MPKRQCIRKKCISPTLPLRARPRRHYLSPPSSFFLGSHGETPATFMFIAIIQLRPSVLGTRSSVSFSARQGRLFVTVARAAQRTTVINQRLNFWQGTAAPAAVSLASLKLTPPSRDATAGEAEAGLASGATCRSVCREREKAIILVKNSPCSFPFHPADNGTLT